MSSYQKQFISIQLAYDILFQAKADKDLKDRWWAGPIDVNGMYSTPILFHSFKDDSTSSAAAKTPANSSYKKYTKKNMRLSGDNTKYTDLKINLNGKLVPFYIDTFNSEGITDYCLIGIKPPEGSLELEEIRLTKPDYTARAGSEKSVMMMLSEYNKILYSEEEREFYIPEDAESSKLFTLMKLVTDAIGYDIKISLSNGSKFTEFLLSEKEEKTDITAVEVLKKYDEQNPYIRKNNLLILSSLQKEEIQSNYSESDAKIILNEILILDKPKPNLCVGADRDKSGKRTVNRILKVKIPCTEIKAGNLVKIEIIDENKSNAAGKVMNATVLNADGNDEPLTLNNIHKFILPKSKIRGEYCLDITVTSFGYSVTLKAERLNVENVSFKKAGVERKPLWVPKEKKEEEEDEDDGAFDEVNANLEDIFGAAALNDSDGSGEV